MEMPVKRKKVLSKNIINKKSVSKKSTYLKVPSNVIKDRLARCRRAMRKHGIKAYLLTGRTDHHYLTGFTGEDSAVLITPGDVHLITDGRFDESSMAECPWAKKRLRKGLLHDEIAAVCKKLKISTLAIQPNMFTLADQASLKKANRTLKLTCAPPIPADLRCIKGTEELAEMKRAILIAEQAFTETVKRIRLGQTELELAARLEYEMKRRGSSAPAFPTICAEGANAALPHAHPGKRRVKQGSAILFDWGTRVGGYCSDLTRVVCVGSIPPKIAEIYPVVLKAQQKAIAAIKPGVRMCEVDAVARDFIAQAGFGDAFIHGLGHGLGLNVHEAPSLSWRSTEKLKVGMVVTVEPGIYLPGVGGVRIEDDVLVTSTGRRIMSRLKKNMADIVIRAKR